VKPSGVLKAKSPSYGLYHITECFLVVYCWFSNLNYVFFRTTKDGCVDRKHIPSYSHVRNIISFIFVFTTAHNWSCPEHIPTHCISQYNSNITLMCMCSSAFTIAGYSSSVHFSSVQCTLLAPIGTLYKSRCSPTVRSSPVSPYFLSLLKAFSTPAKFQFHTVQESSCKQDSDCRQ
jgi:hypothetical protein